MSTDNLGAGLEGIEEEETPQWDLFVGRAAVSTAFMESKLKDFKKSLQDVTTPPTPLDKKIMLKESKRYMDELKALKTEYNDLTMKEKISFERMQNTHVTLVSLENDLAVIQEIIEDELPPTQAQPPQQLDMNTHLANMVSTVQNIANGPHMQLPYFSGKITSYAGFKKQFLHTITQIPGPKHLYATHLINSLKGEANKIHRRHI